MNKLDAPLHLFLYETELSVRIKNALLRRPMSRTSPMKDMELKTVRDLCALCPEDLLTLPNFGRESLKALVAALEANGLQLRTGRPADRLFVPAGVTACQECGKPGAILASCPFHMEVNDSDMQCACCPDCRSSCAECI